MYLPIEWGPRTRETTLLGDLAMTTRRAGLGCAQRGSSEIRMRGSNEKPAYLGILTDLLPCKTTRVYHSL